MGVFSVRYSGWRARTHPSVAALDRARHLALYAAREYSLRAALPSERWEALSLARGEQHHVPNCQQRLDARSGYCRTRTDAGARTRRSRDGHGNRRRVRASAHLGVHVKQLRIVMVGDVDAGKSTILGRLLVDVGQVTPAKLAELESSSTKRGVPIEYSFLLDAFQVERDQAITLDITRVWVRTPDAEFVFVDAPGHRELIRDLLSGASEVDVPVMVVTADEGITPQTRKQALFLQWLGFPQ